MSSKSPFCTLFPRTSTWRVPVLSPSSASAIAPAGSATALSVCAPFETPRSDQVTDAVALDPGGARRASAHRSRPRPQGMRTTAPAGTPASPVDPIVAVTVALCVPFVLVASTFVTVRFGSGRCHCRAFESTW